jgi:hypothetical protein
LSVAQERGARDVGLTISPRIDEPMPRSTDDAIALGPPSVLAVWAFDLLREACALVPERAETRAIDREDAVEPRGARRPLIYLSHFPSVSLLTECAETRSPVLVCLDDPVDAVRFLQQRSSGSLVEALRLQTAAAAPYAQLRDHPRLLTLHRLADAPTAEIIDAILEHFDFEMTAKQYEMLSAKRLGPKGRDADLESSLQACVGGYALLKEAQAQFSAKEIAMIGGVLVPLVQMALRDDAGPIVWPIETFLSGDRPDTPASLIADLTGAARILYYGPYFYLPAGSWTVRMTIGFSAGARRTPFSVEVYGGRLLAHATMVPEAKGVYHASFRFAHEDPLQAVEVRVRTDRGAIEGRLALGKVEFSRAIRNEAQSDRKLEGAG